MPLSEGWGSPAPLVVGSHLGGQLTASVDSRIWAAKTGGCWLASRSGKLSFGRCNGAIQQLCRITIFKTHGVATLNFFQEINGVCQPPQQLVVGFVFWLFPLFSWFLLGFFSGVFEHCFWRHVGQWDGEENLTMRVVVYHDVSCMDTALWMAPTPATNPQNKSHFGHRK